MDKLGGLGGLSSLDTLGGSSQDLTTEELLQLARNQGGRVGQIAEELAGTNKSRTILSQIGGSLKDGFNKFIDVISIPGQVVAGMISPDFTIEEAIKENKRVSDVIFGDGTKDFNGDGNITTMEKVGDFLVRLPVDILSDPLTYLTFGASSAKGLFGAMGLRSTSKVTALGKTQSLSDIGQDVLGYTQKLEKQMRGQLGTRTAKEVGQDIAATKKGLIEAGVDKAALDFTEQEMKALMKSTIEQPFDIDIAKKTMTKLFENSPALVSDFIDKGGIKFFGKSILSAQRIDSVIQTIPPFKYIDHVTKPLRDSVSSLFNPNLVKVGDEYIRLPEEYINMRQSLKDIGESTRVDIFRNMSNLQKELNLSEKELDLLTSALQTRQIPIDSRLANAYMKLIGIQEKNVEMLKSAGIPISKMDNYVGLLYIPNDTRNMRFNSTFGKEVGATKQANYAKFIKQAGEGEIQALPQVKEIIAATDNKYKDLVAEINSVKSVQEVGLAIGKKQTEVIKQLTDNGMSLEKARQSAEVLELDELRKKLDGVELNEERVGRQDKLQMSELGLDEDEYGYFKDKEGDVFKRVATTAQELSAAGIEGFDPNVITAYTVRSLQNAKQTLGHQFAEGLARNFGRWSDEAPDGWLPLSNTLVNDAANDIAGRMVRFDGVEMVFHPAIAKDFEKMMKVFDGDVATKDFLKAYDRLQGYWKASVTSIFPMFHGRNAISNVFLNFLDLGVAALDPRKHATAVDLIAKDRKLVSLQKKALGSGDEAVQASKEISDLMRTKMFTDRNGYEWSFGELHTVARKNNIAFNPNIAGYIDVNNDRESLARYFGFGQSKSKQMLQKANPLNQEQFAPFRGGRELGRAVEEQARLVNFMSNLINTGDVTHATARSKQFLFDYQNLTNLEREVLRRIIPFYTFTRKNLELQAKTVLTAPGRVASEIKAAQSLGGILGGEPMTDDEKKLLPSWLSNSLNLKRRTEDGKWEVITGFGLPIEQPFQQFQSQQLLGSISPIIRFPVEKMTGYQFFRGKPTSEVIKADDFRDAPKAIKDFIGYVQFEGKDKDGNKYVIHNSLRPENMHTLMNLPFSRVVSTLSDITNKDVSGDLRLLQSLTGVRAVSFNEDVAAQQKEREMIRSLEKLLKDAGIRGEFKRGYNLKNTTILE